MALGVERQAHESLRPRCLLKEEERQAPLLRELSNWSLRMFIRGLEVKSSRSRGVEPFLFRRLQLKCGVFVTTAGLLTVGLDDGVIHCPCHVGAKALSHTVLWRLDGLRLRHGGIRCGDCRAAAGRGVTTPSTSCPWTATPRGSMAPPARLRPARLSGACGGWLQGL